MAGGPAAVPVVVLAAAGRAGAAAAVRVAAGERRLAAYRHHHGGGDARRTHPQAFAAGHIPGAQHLTNQNVAAFLAQGDRQRPLIVCCYHGHSSRDAAEFLAEQGFAEVYSLDGGFEAWRLQQPVE